jgi:hypothetical protein
VSASLSSYSPGPEDARSSYPIQATGNDDRKAAKGALTDPLRSAVLPFAYGQALLVT